MLQAKRVKVAAAKAQREAEQGAAKETEAAHRANDADVQINTSQAETGATAGTTAADGALPNGEVDPPPGTDVGTAGTQQVDAVGSDADDLTFVQVRPCPSGSWLAPHIACFRPAPWSL